MKKALIRFGLMVALAVPLALQASCNSNMVGGGPEDGGANDDSGTIITEPPKIPGCVGVCLVNNSCPASGPTTITGTVTIPSGLLPLYNAKVYIPVGDAMPPPPPSGVSCDRCGNNPSPFYTTTDVKGQFALKNVPSGQNIPLIIQVGKWRRTITLPPIADCTTTALPAAQTRLPKNQSEGNIPKIALSTGALDAMECILRKNKLGLDDTEFTNPDKNGRVNLYAGAGGTDRFQAGGTLFPTSAPWWDTAENWQQYDIVMMSCEGAANAAALTKKMPSARQSMQTYLNLGGRVFLSHWHNVWLQNAVAAPPPSTEPPLSSVAQFVDAASDPGYTNDTTLDEATIDISTPKGMALKDWLTNATALNANGTLPVKYSKATLTKRNGNVNPSTENPNPAYAKNLITLTKTAGALNANLASPPPQYFAFNAPLSQPANNQCGQLVFTDLHISGAPSNMAGDHSANGTLMAFPNGCTTTTLSPQEMALIFLIFDLTSCLAPVIG